MIICSYSNIDIIQGVIGYGDAEGIVDWRIANTSNGILNILNSSSANTSITINTNGNVGIGSKDPFLITDLLDVSGNINISGIYEINGRDVLNDTSNYVLSTSNILVDRILSSATGGGGTSQWTNVPSGIFYNTSNVGIGTNTPQTLLHIRNDATIKTALTIQNNFPLNVSVSPSTTSGTTGIYTYYSFLYTTETGGSGSRQTLYTFNVLSGSITCDVLIVGGGGGGSEGGGGGGGYVYQTNLTIPAGSYSVRVGNGGNGGTPGQYGIQGASSSFIVGGTTYIAYGGGGAGAGFAPAHTTGQVGSYGGNGFDTRTTQTYTSTQGNRGGTAVTSSYGSGGGGGGAGGVGGDANFASPGVTAGSGLQYYRGGTGGNGLSNSITGTAIFYAGGGTGGANTNSGTDTTAQTAPVGGGGIGSRAPGGAGGNGVDGTGGGGGGGDDTRTTAARGGSGIVIIRFVSPGIPTASIELVRGIPGDSNIDYKIGNYAGEFKIQASDATSDTDYIRITATGASIYNPTGSPQWSTTSDIRIKENIERASYDICYDNINKLDLYRFNYINGFNNVNRDLRQLGFIAQEVKDIFPKAVSSQSFNNNDVSISDLLSIDITQINYSLYGAVKKLIEMNEDKEGRINSLLEMNDYNEFHIKRLETLLNIDTSNLSLDTSNIAIDTSNISIDTSNLSIDTSNIAIDTSNIQVE
jgi:hypothetical protein